MLLVRWRTHASTPVRRSSASPHAPACAAIDSATCRARPASTASAWTATQSSAAGSSLAWKHHAAAHTYSCYQRDPDPLSSTSSTIGRIVFCHRCCCLIHGFQRREEGTGIVAYCLPVRPADGDRTWTVVDASYATVGPVEEWLEAHRHLWSPSTVRGYAASLAQWWSFLEQRGEAGQWAEAGVPAVAGFLSWLRIGRTVEHALTAPSGGSVGGDAARAAGRADLVLPVAGGGPLGAGRGPAAARAGCPDAVTRIARAPGRRAPTGSVIAGQGAPPPDGPASAAVAAGDPGDH